MAGDPSWQQRYDHSLAQEGEANIAALRAYVSRPFLPFLLKQLLVGLGFGLLGWLMINWVWGLVSFIATAGVGLLGRVHASRRLGKEESSSDVQPPEATGSP